MPITFYGTTDQELINSRIKTRTWSITSIINRKNEKNMEFVSYFGRRHVSIRLQIQED